MDEATNLTLGDIATWYSGGTPKAGTPGYYGGGIPWAVIADLNDDIVVETASSITEAGLAVIGGRMAPRDAVMISMYGTIGRVGLVGRPMATNQAIAWGVVNESTVLPLFVVLLLQHNRAAIDALGRGATQRNINREIIRGFPVRVPPLAEQRRIVDLIGSVNAVSTTASSVLARTRELRTTLLEELLSGKHGLPASYERFLETSHE